MGRFIELHGQVGNTAADLSGQEAGLSEAEAAARLIRDGPNRLPQTESRSVFRITQGLLREPVFQLLLAAGLLYFVIGELLDAVVLSFFVVLSAAISIVQQKRADRVMESLRHLAAPRAVVIRSGFQRRLPAQELVRGDLILLMEGDRVAADSVLLGTQELHIDESLLTGESEPVVKSGSGEGARQQVFLGTLVVRGRGLARVVAIGQDTACGKIGLSVGRIMESPSRLSLEIRRLMRWFTTLAVLVSVLVFSFYWQSTRDALSAALAGITAAMGLIPEEFAVVLTVFMAMGAWRLSKHDVLTRQADAIESLGAATVLCTDKTGTLTLNEMRVAALALNDEQILMVPTPISQPIQELLWSAASACEAHSLDPMEKAIDAFYREIDVSGLRESLGWRIRSYGLSPDFPAMTQVWGHTERGDRSVLMKGAPETVLTTCQLASGQRERILQTVSAMAARGLRVLAIAKGGLTHGAELPDHPRGFAMRFIGLIGLADPLRPSVPEAVRQCHAAGIRVVMITGDYPVTALAIARQAGIIGPEPSGQTVLTGDQLEQLSDAALAHYMRQVRVCARIQPIQKLRIVQTLKREGEVVAMTGDGVNDAPALKAADIGIAMGARGTDVAREAAALVLLREDFGAIVEAVGRGRQIYANLRKAVGFIVSIHVPIAGLAAFPVLLGLPALFFPVHIAFMEMVIDPAGSFVYESEPADEQLMRRPPRPKAEFIYPLPLMARSVVQGGLVLVTTLIGYLVVRTWLEDPAVVRGIVFIGLVTSSLAVVSLHMQRRRGLQLFGQKINIAFLLIVGLTLTVLSLLFSVSWLREVFQFEAAPLPWVIGALAFGLGNYGVLRIADAVLPRMALSTT